MSPFHTWITTGRLTIWGVKLLASFVFASNAAAQAPPLAAFSAASGSGPVAPWRLVGLPGGKVPLTKIDLVESDGVRVARLQAERSYGNWVHALAGDWTPSTSSSLTWRWRLEQPVQGADLRTKPGDDIALKLCLSFDLPLSALSFGERTLLRLARANSSEPLPAATLCYIWDPGLPAGQILPSAFTQRVRYWVLDGQASPLGQWRNHQRSPYADFLRAFGHETTTVPAMTAVLIGADADNTGARSLSFVGDITLKP